MRVRSELLVDMSDCLLSICSTVRVLAYHWTPEAMVPTTNTVSTTMVLWYVAVRALLETNVRGPVDKLRPGSFHNYFDN